MASGSASTAGRATEPARGIRTLEKSGVPPGRTAGSGTCSFSGPELGHPVALFSLVLSVRGPGRVHSRPALSAPRPHRRSAMCRDRALRHVNANCKTSSGALSTQEHRWAEDINHQSDVMALP